MNKRIAGLVVVLVASIGILAWYTFFSGITSFDGEYKYVYLHPDSLTREQILTTLQRDSVLKSKGSFDWLARQREYYSHAKPGKYRIENGANPVSLLRTLGSGNQEQERLVIKKLRLPEDLAALIAKKTLNPKDSTLVFLRSNDSLSKLGLDTNRLMSNILPNTYFIYWTNSTTDVLKKLKAASDKWWNEGNRRALLDTLNLNEHEVYTLASIVDEETNKASDKPLIASVYLNRLKKGMPLQADPTIRYARRDFLSNRVTYAQLRTPSPYNTYLNKGLPPGPICTAQPSTIDSVLHAPETDYLFFVAKADFSGYSVFSANLRDHNKVAKQYQDSLNAWLKRKADKEKAKADSASAPRTNP